MIGLIWKTIRTATFTIVVLILGNLIQWQGRTLSEHVQVQMNAVKDSAPVRNAQTKVRGWIGRVSANVKQGTTDRLQTRAASPSKTAPSKADQPSQDDRQELKTLLETGRD
jgi:hypothetical protein